MKKAFLFIGIGVLLLLIAAAVVFWLTADKTADHEEEKSSPPVTAKELVNENRRFYEMIDSIDMDSVTKVELVEVNVGTGQAVVHTSEDAEVIRTWVKLLKRMKVAPAEFDPALGAGYVLTIYQGEEAVTIGGFLLPYIYNQTDRTMVIVTNFAELEPEFAKARALLTKKEAK